MNEITRFLSAVRRRLRLSWGLATAQLAIPIAAGGAVLLVLLGRWRPWAWTEPLAALVVVLSAVLIVAIAAVVRLPDPIVARAADRGLATRDAFTSALQFRGRDDSY